jgi:hypothetical protein
MDVRPDYVICVYPVLFMAAGRFIAALWERTGKGPYHALGVLALVAATMMPEFISTYTGKRSLDIRKAVEFVESSYVQGDRILSFMIEFNFYLGEEYNIEPYLGAVYQPDWKARLKRYDQDRRRLWIVFKEGRGAVNPELKRWLHEKTRLMLEVVEKRYDYTYRTIRVYLKDT